MANIVKAALSVPEELLVFGYSCKLFRDDEKAQFIESGSHLIPWMGDTTMMIDRYDVRGALYDLGAAASSGPAAVLTEVELKEEELCEYERYVALYYDLDVIAEKEEEESKRLQMELAHGTSSFSQVGYSYDGFPMAVSDTADDSSQTSNVPQPALDTVVSVPLQNKPHDKFTPPSSLSLPPGIVVPTSLKQHKIIVKTAGFIAKQGSQMEIILKTKQTGNALFGFMSFDNSLNAYYKHIVGLMKSGRYVEEQQDEDPVEDAPAASFNPSADAAPDAATPSRKVTTSSDCSYSKLISKIKENQAKQANSQASAADAISQQTEKSKASIQSVAQAPLAVPSSPCVQPAAADKTVAPNKPFAGLVDYPSFNQADESDYSYSDSDSHSPVTPAPQNGDIQPKVTKNKDKSCLGKRNSSLKKDGEVSNVIDSYDAVKWPSNRDQMVIDKIACYIVKNGSKFEQTIKSRGDPRFDFLKTGNDYNKYFELKKSLFAEIFGEHLSKSASKRSESTRDMKTVIAASKSMAGSDCVSSPPTISFKLKQRKDQEVTLPPTSFPLESSSSEEDLENLDAEEQQKRQELRQERRRWRQMKREQFEQEKKERKLREEELEKKRAEEAKRAAMKNYDEYERPKAMQEEEENSSADEEMYDIFKYAQENRGADEYGDSCDAQEAAAAPAKPSEKRRKRKAAAHAFISKLKVDPANPPAPPMIGPQLPPEIAALMMAATTSPPPPPSPLPSSPTLSPRPASSCPPSSPPSPRTPQPLSKDHSPSMDRSRSPAAVVSEPAEDGLISTAHDDTVSQAAPLCTSGDAPASPSLPCQPAKKPPGLLAAAVSSLLINDETATRGGIASSPFASSLSRGSSSRSSRVKKRKSSKHRERSLSASSERSPSTSSKKRKRKHHRHERSSHHKKRRHHSDHSSSRKPAHSSSKKKSKSKKKKSKSSKRSKNKKASRSHRNASVSSSSSDDEFSSYSRSSSEPESSGSYKYRDRRSEDKDAQSGDDIQVIESDSSSSSVMSVPRTLAPLPTAAVTTASSRASSSSREAFLVSETRPPEAASSTPATSPPPAPKLPLPTTFDLKSSSAVARITQGLRAKVHALMEKPRAND